jgi:GNAT superfamily N-acetyltransferase
MAVHVRRARDIAEFQQFRALQIEYEQSLPPDLRHSLPDLPSLQTIYDGPDAAFLASIDQDASGCTAVTRLDVSTSVLKRLYVAPAYRGLGIARALIDVATSFSRDQQHDRIVLDTDRERLPAAYQLYLSLGFEQCEPYGPVDYASPTYMELRLR